MGTLVHPGKLIYDRFTDSHGLSVQLAGWSDNSF